MQRPLPFETLTDLVAEELKHTDDQQQKDALLTWLASQHPDKNGHLSTAQVNTLIEEGLQTWYEDDSDAEIGVHRKHLVMRQIRALLRVDTSTKRQTA